MKTLLLQHGWLRRARLVETSTGDLLMEQPPSSPSFNRSQRISCPWPHWWVWGHVCICHSLDRYNLLIPASFKQMNPPNENTVEQAPPGGQLRSQRSWTWAADPRELRWMTAPRPPLRDKAVDDGWTDRWMTNLLFLPVNCRSECCHLAVNSVIWR